MVIEGEDEIVLLGLRKVSGELSIPGSALYPETRIHRHRETVLKQILRPRESSELKFMWTSSRYCVRPEASRMLTYPVRPQVPMPRHGARVNPGSFLNLQRK